MLKNIADWNSLWHFPVQLLYTQVGLTGHWCLEFPWGCWRFLYPEVSSIRSSSYFIFFSFGLKPEKDSDRQVHIYVMFTKTNHHFVASFSPFPIQHFTSCFTQTCCCLESTLPSPTWRCCFKELAGCGRGVLLLPLKKVCQGSCVTHIVPLLNARGGFLEVIEVCGYMGGPAGWLGHRGERGLYLNW